MKIIGSDYDGTLNHGGIGAEKCAAIHRWRACGNKFGIISGRGKEAREGIQAEHPTLELDFFASCSGAMITDGEGRVIHEDRCTEVSVPRLAADLAAWGCCYVSICSTQAWFVRFPVVDETADVPQFSVPELPEVDYFNQVSTYIEPLEAARAVVERIREAYGEWLNPLQNGCCIDIVPAGVNKAEGLYRLMEHYGCGYGDVIAVGDNINDTDMIREFRSYAMANGVDSIKELADFVVGDVVDLIEAEM